MSSKLRFDGKVVIITGGGGGLGRSYAIEFAKRGAHVVVNDLRGAEEVAKEIVAGGGSAVADSNNVVDGAKIVETAVKEFGTVHVVVNNAGILRDTSFAKMDDSKFNLVLQVHLQGAYAITKAAWPYFRKQKYGRIINASSPAGLYGNFGQANYSAAKLALIGFAETLAKEGVKYNILANSIAPTARSQMTEGILPPDILKKVSAEYITPLVVFLAHESLTANDTGKTFELAGGYYAQTRWERSAGELFYPDDSLTAEAILHRIESIRDFEHNKPFKSTEHPTQPVDYVALASKAKKLTTPNDQGHVKVTLRNKVVLITGAGAGLGRAHSLWLAKYGAKVVVNDIVNPDSVVAEIRAAGGDAHPDKHDAATDAAAIVQNALDKYGRIDALINNAGILRDKSFTKMTDKQWNDVLAVHLQGTYKLCRAVWPIFLKQKAGNIVNVTSTSGIYGSFGQANYAAAKMGILGLSRTLAIEGAKKGIKVNVIAPHAETAMTKTIFTEKEYNLFPPELVSPMLVLLSSDQVPGVGHLYELGGGWVGATRLQTAKGAVAKSSPVTAEFIADNWADITDFSSGTTHASNIAESLTHILGKISSASENDEEDDDDDDDEEAKTAVDKNGNPVFVYTKRDTILYNIGVGAKAAELKYVYENDPNFQLVPSFGAVVLQNTKTNLDFAKLMSNFNPVFLLHGEQYIRIEQWPLPTAASLASESFPVAIANKGKKAAVLVTGTKSYDTATGNPVFYNEMTTFNRGAQARKGDQVFKPRPKLAAINLSPPKDIEPDFVKNIETSVDQAAIYRLSGDYNPLHIDPEFAKNAQFPKPILHGLGYLGISVKALLEHYGPIHEIKVRFSGSVFPGDTLQVKGWKRGDLVVFETYDLLTKKIVISSAAIKLFGDKTKL